MYMQYRPEPMKRVLLALPREVVHAIDARVSPRGRSAFTRECIGLRLLADLRREEAGGLPRSTENIRWLIHSALAAEYERTSPPPDEHAA
jgi:hypothetical protein